MSHSETLSQIKQERQYPGVLDYDLFCRDPKYSKKVLDAGLELEGLVTVQRTQKLIDAGKPLIGFTKKQKAFYFPHPRIIKAVLYRK